MKASELLSAARERVAAGWIKGDLSNAQGVCMAGAIHEAKLAHPTAEYSEACVAIRRKIGEMWPDAFVFLDGLPTFSDFNDAPERTHEDVLAVFDKTIAALQEMGE